MPSDHSVIRHRWSKSNCFSNNREAANLAIARLSAPPKNSHRIKGFRVAFVPESSSIVLLGTGILVC